MIIGNTVTVDRQIVGGERVVYRVSLSYNDGDSQRDVTVIADDSLGAVFELAARVAKLDLAGRAPMLAAAALEADALTKEVKS